MELGERIKELRERRGVSQREMATAIKISPTSMSRIEAGLQEPSGKLVAAIAEYLGVSTDYLLGLGAKEGDLAPDLRELFELAVDAGYVADLKDFFRWLAAKREKLVREADGIPRQPDEELLALVPGLTEGEIKAILLKFKGEVVKRIAKLTPEQTKAFNEEVAKILHYLELEAKVKKSGELTESDL